MAKSPAVSINNFKHDSLRKLLNSRKAICIVGYGVSYEAHAPHYYDIQKGVWSNLTPDSRINPFMSDKHYQVVMNWLIWRRGGIRTSLPAKPFQTLRQIQQEFGLTVATQCVDGLIRVNGVENTFDLYGDVLKARCHEQGHEFSHWSYKSAGDGFSSVCEICGSLNLPDVQMFGWNSKAVICNELVDRIKQATLLIKIGTDQDMAPFNMIPNHSDAHLPIVEILDTGITFQDGKSFYNVSSKEINDEIARLSGEKISRSADKTYDSVMQSFLQLYKS